MGMVVMGGPGRGAPTCPRGSGGGARYRYSVPPPGAPRPLPPLPGQPPGGTRSLPLRVAAAPRGCHRNPPAAPGPARSGRCCPVAAGERRGPAARELRSAASTARGPQPPGCAFTGVFLVLGETPTGPGRKRRGEPGGNRSQGTAARCRERSCGPVPCPQPRPGSGRGRGRGACGPRARPLRYRGCPAAPRCPPALSAPSGRPGPARPQPGLAPAAQRDRGSPGPPLGRSVLGTGGVPHPPRPAPAARCCPGTSPL